MTSYWMSVVWEDDDGNMCHGVIKVDARTKEAAWVVVNLYFAPYHRVWITDPVREEELETRMRFNTSPSEGK